jgi:hypothetical protein
MSWKLRWLARRRDLRQKRELMAVEPISPTAFTFSVVTGSAAIPVLHVLGIPLGIRPDILMWGLIGGIIALIHLRAPPPSASVWRAVVAGLYLILSLLASAVTSGILSEAIAIMLHAAIPIIPPEVTLSMTAFVIGATSQQTLAAITSRFDKIIKG